MLLLIDLSIALTTSLTRQALSPSQSRPEPGAKGFSYYDCALDPWQTKNIYGSLSGAEKAALAGMLAAVKDCKGTACP